MGWCRSEVRAGVGAKNKMRAGNLCAQKNTVPRGSVFLVRPEFLIPIGFCASSGFFYCFAILQSPLSPKVYHHQKISRSTVSLVVNKTTSCVIGKSSFIGLVVFVE